ncbi:hypothetical protein PGB28_03365 [Primorskyibacter aestuariivivens]|uniref:hypothetical protein n=1 Tax=Primorskyibacter aestuariivivens TaxID=1888912 RepID=UPI002301A4E1|nr:hypothetical protein [Primorskyibacter aestuariivivens]MDA7427484.1 hypothetical protein [Primorskyibacter aestuariivivens]
MKALTLTACLAVSSLAALPAIAQDATDADPFIATQGDGTALGVVGGMTLLILIAAATNDSSSGTD